MVVFCFIRQVWTKPLQKFGTSVLIFLCNVKVEMSRKNSLSMPKIYLFYLYYKLIVWGKNWTKKHIKTEENILRGSLHLGWTDIQSKSPNFIEEKLQHGKNNRKYSVTQSTEKLLKRLTIVLIFRMNHSLIRK